MEAFICVLYTHTYIYIGSRNGGLCTSARGLQPHFTNPDTHARVRAHLRRVLYIVTM